MSIQTEAMREDAEESHYVTAFEDDEGWHGIEFVNHPTPSGCRRDMPTYSDKRGWPDAETAIRKLKEALSYTMTAKDAQAETGDSDAR